jgi:endoglucanase
MKPFMITLLCGVLLAACGGKAKPTTTPLPTQAPPTSTLAPTATLNPVPTRAPSPTLPSAPIFERNNRIGRAVNLGNALEAPNEGEWGVTLKAEYFSLIKNVGFTAVRIPIRFSAHAAAEAPYTLDSLFLARVDWAVNNALDQGLVAIVDMHHYLEIFEQPMEHKARFLAIWQQLAEHYQDYSPDVYFELLNEPNGQLTTDLWGQFAAEAVKIIRRTNPTRPIIIGPGEWNSYTQFQYFTPPDDANIIITFHYYSPFQFTHQGAEWASGSEAWLGTKWTGSDTQRRIMRSDFSIAADWGRRNNRPIFLGEFGAYSKADMNSRALWTDAVARTAEEMGISWSYWEFCSGFGVYDPVAEQWRDPLLKALIP